MIDFVLVPDGLSGSFVRNKLAKSRLNGVKVGNFSALLETLKSLWVFDVSDNDWDKKLLESALMMDSAFWSQSISVDEQSVIHHLDKSLKHMLSALPLNASFSKIKKPESKSERYFNDLVDLHKKMQRIRPLNQEVAKKWLNQVNGLSLDTINLYLNTELFQFDTWQHEVINELSKNAEELTQNQSLILDVLENTSNEYESKFSPLKNSLFTSKDPIDIPNGFNGLKPRDDLEACEVVASMIQKAIKNDISFDEIAVVYPSGTNYPIWLAKVFQQAGISVSNLPSQQTVFDWQTALLRDLVLLQAQNTPPMARMSVLSNPLMPWRNHKSRISIIENELDDNVRAVANEISEGFIDLLEQKTKDSNETIQWLTEIAKHFKPLNELGLTNERFNDKLKQLESWFELYAKDSFVEQCQKLLNQLQAHSINLSSEKNHYLNAVTVLASNEVLLKPVKHLFIIGFNQGHYSSNASALASKTVLNNQAWSLLGKKVGLDLNSFEQKVDFDQYQLKELLGKAQESLTILASQQDFEGGRLHLSETALDVALCFMPPEKVDPDSLFETLPKANHPLLEFAEVIIPEHASINIEDLDLKTNILNLHTDEDGNQRSESPSSFETMMVSPLAWLLDRQGIKDKGWNVQELDVMLQGTVAHKVFELFKEKQDKAFSDSLYNQLFQQAVTKEASFLLESEWRLELVQLKQQVKPAFEKFIRWSSQTGWRIAEVEQRFSGEIWGTPVKGFADAILKKETSVLVLDYKKSKSKDRLTRLSRGFDLQTYIYRELYQQQYGQTEIHSGYYNLNDQVMVLDQIQAVDSDIKVVAPDISIEEQSVKARNLVQNRLSQLQSGQVELNSNQDQANWEKEGIKAYALKDNPVVTRFMKVVEGE
ncbi:PD-(D/E)XK nuclease family protein [Thiomicrorhabdus sp. Milos-T2]|uniref:PD-(D/E)XK nuclease family protein n=1 Tax=Thiomicrorhabdus sp. Milos-T2 TaxID=90814 RepID=UPI00049441C5|nr:PD-(D/E)XK nuclease family protein [Thiomicrorhabdus sp. Milos-T2]